MTYLALNAVFLAAVLAVAAMALVVAKRSTGQRAASWLRAVGLTLLALVVATAIFDNVMIAVGLVDYDPGAISGIFLALAPVEDFAYALAAAVLLPSLWVLLPKRTDDREHHADSAPGAGVQP